MDILPSSFFDPKTPIKKNFLSLPHWQQDWKLAFITIHFGDALPKIAIDKFQAELALWKQQHPTPWNEQETLFYRKNFEGFAQKYLDKGYGCSIMKDPIVAAELEKSLLHDNGVKYDLISYVIMCNHAHVLVKLHDKPMDDFIREWKRFSASRMNKMAGRQGPLWQREYWDTLIRTNDHYHSVLAYIDNNFRHGGILRGPKP